MKILVVEGQQSDRFAMKKMLQPIFQVITLSSAKEATAYALCHTFDVALIDVVHSGDADSIELLNDLKNINATDFTAFAILRQGEKTKRNRLIAAGFKAVMHKPFTLQHLSDLLQVDTLHPTRG